MADKKKYDVGVAVRSVKLQVYLPYKHLFDFMKAFGERFATRLHGDGKADLAKVDDYGAHMPENSWVRVCVLDSQEKEFYAWLESFCKTKEITFDDPMMPALVKELCEFYK